MHETETEKLKGKSISGGGNSNQDNEQRRAEEQKKELNCARNQTLFRRQGKTDDRRYTKDYRVEEQRGQSIVVYNTTNGANIVYITSLQLDSELFEGSVTNSQNRS